jgi:hypothetical protein
MHHSKYHDRDFLHALSSCGCEISGVKTLPRFTASSSDPLNIGPTASIILSRVITNVGNGYDPQTGVFTVPVTGLYDIQLTYMAHGS